VRGSTSSLPKATIDLSAKAINPSKCRKTLGFGLLRRVGSTSSEKKDSISFSGKKIWKFDRVN
jgi:hypothetical protein